MSAPMNWTDWVGLWAAIQVIGMVLGFALLVGGTVVIVIWVFAEDWLRSRRKAGRKS